MSTEFDYEGIRVLDYNGQKVLATEIRKGKSLKEIAEKLGVDIEIVKATAEKVVQIFVEVGRTSSTVDKLKQALFDCDIEDWYREEKSE